MLKGVLTVQVLSGEEGWILFTMLAGKSIEAPDLRPVAEKVVDECKGVPIALVTVGRALRNKPIAVWNDALLQLRKALPTNISGMIADVYRPLKLSYTHLESDEAKSLFLLCCLFQEDFNIPIEDLTRYGLGLRMFLGIENLEEARNRANSLVDTLKDRFLLIQGYRSSHVKMHDLIRDVAIFIASQDNQNVMISHNVNLEEWPIECSSSSQPYTSISFMSKVITALPGLLDCPKLELLQLECNKQPLEAPESFFKGMTALKVLDMCAVSLPSLPSSLGSLTNLRVLHLYGCSLENICILGKLINLEVLSLRGSLIKELPAEMGKLTKLRLLDMSGCEDLITIAANVISSFTRLEELLMGHNYNFKWEALGEGDDEGRRNIAALSELEALQSLTTLEIQVPDSSSIPINMHLSSKLTKYAISIRDVLPKKVKKCFQRAMYLFLPTMAPLAYWIQVALRDTEYLNLAGEGSINAVKALVPDGFRHVKVLKIDSCDVLEHLVSRVEPGATIFPALESLDLCNLAILKELCHGQLYSESFNSLKELKLDLLDSLENVLIGQTGEGSLANLRSICISRCHRLQYLFPFSTLARLLHLKELKISDCNIMQEVFPGDWVDTELLTAGFDRDTGLITACFRTNMRVSLVDLPNLVTICKGIPYDPYLYASQGPQIVEEQDLDFPDTSFPR
nr:disease resistance protein At4g27190-like [Ipomoea batatas]